MRCGGQNLHVCQQELLLLLLLTMTKAPTSALLPFLV